MPDGRILASYEVGAANVQPSLCLGRYSPDKGYNWLSPFTIPETNNPVNYDIVPFIHDQKFIYFYNDWTGYETNPFCSIGVKMTPDYFSTVNDGGLLDKTGKSSYITCGMNMITLQNGAHVFPCSYDAGGNSGAWRCFLYWCAADRDPYTASNWTITPDAPLGSADHLDEPTCVEIAGSKVLVLFRTGTGVHFKCIWDWATKAWGSTVNTPLLCPSVYASGAPAYLRRVSWNPNLVLVSYDRSPLYRRPLVISSTTDDGLTWGDYSVLEDSQTVNISYPALQVLSDGSILAGWWYSVSGSDEETHMAIIQNRNVVVTPPSGTHWGKGIIRASMFSQGDVLEA
jgi:hypothetical protein